jgi:hypothetical protein
MQSGSEPFYGRQKAVSHQVRYGLSSGGRRIRTPGPWRYRPQEILTEAARHFPNVRVVADFERISVSARNAGSRGHSTSTIQASLDVSATRQGI